MIPFIKVNVYEQVNFFRVIVLSGSERRFDNKGPAVKSRKTAICIKLQRNRAQLQAAGFFTAVELPVTVEVVTEQGMALREQAVDIPAKMAGCVCLSREDAATLYTVLHKIMSGICEAE